MADVRGPHSSIQWLIKTESDRQLGPYSTEAVLKLISQGALSGGEQIKRYPDGKWAAISRQPDFYDKLLDALEEIPKFDPNRRERIEADTIVAPMPERQQSEDHEKTVIVPRSQITIAEQKTQLPVIENESPAQSVQPVVKREPIQLEPVSKLSKKQKTKSIQIPLILGAVAILFIVVAYLIPERASIGKPHLLVPRA